MKFKSIFLAIILGQFACGGEANDVKGGIKKLESISGNDRPAAQELIVALRSGRSDSMRGKMSELVQQGKSHLVVLSLADSSDMAKIEAAKALVSVKKKSVAQALVDASESFDSLVAGGTEQTGRRDMAKAEFARTLTTITGVEVNKNWTYAERVNALKDAISKLPE